MRFRSYSIYATCFLVSLLSPTLLTVYDVSKMSKIQTENKFAPSTDSRTDLALTIQCLGSIDEVVSLGDEIDALSDVIFLRTAWMVSWLKSFRSTYQRPMLLACRREDKLVALLPLVLSHSLKRGDHLVFVGHGKACSDFMTIAGATDDDVIACFSDWLMNHSDQWDRIEFHGVSGNDPAISRLVENLNQSGCTSEEHTALSTWRLSLPESWEEFQSTLSKNSRKKFRRQQRSLEEAGAKFLRVHDDASLRRGVEVLKELHTKRWQSLGGEGCYASEGFEEFIELGSEAHLQQDTLVLVWLEVEGEPIAADIAFASGRGLYTYQGGISPDHLKWEPGRAILRSQLEWAMENGLEFIDFLRGDEPYKTRWQTEETSAVVIEVTGTGFKAGVVSKLLQAGRLIKSMMDLDSRETGE